MSRPAPLPTSTYLLAHSLTYLLAAAKLRFGFFVFFGFTLFVLLYYFVIFDVFFPLSSAII